MENCLANARVLSRSLEATGWYVCVSDIHRPIPKGNSPGATQVASDAAEKVKDAVTSAVGSQEKPRAETSADFVAGLPVVSFRFTDEFKREFPHIQQETVSLLLRARQWIIPNYALPPKENATEILRVVIRENMSFDLLDRLVTDIVQVTETLIDHGETDLSLLQKHVHKSHRHPAQKGHHKNKHGGVKKTEEVGRDVKRMAEGIHRSVC